MVCWKTIIFSRIGSILLLIELDHLVNFGKKLNFAPSFGTWARDTLKKDVRKLFQRPMRVIFCLRIQFYAYIYVCIILLFHFLSKCSNVQKILIPLLDIVYIMYVSQLKRMQFDASIYIYIYKDTNTHMYTPNNYYYYYCFISPVNVLIYWRFLIALVDIVCIRCVS